MSAPPGVRRGHREAQRVRRTLHQLRRDKCSLAPCLAKLVEGLRHEVVDRRLHQFGESVGQVHRSLDRNGGPPGLFTDRGGRPRSLRVGERIPRASSRSSAMAITNTSRAESSSRRTRRFRVDHSASRSQSDGQRHQLLLGPFVQISLHPPAGVIGNGDEAATAGLEFREHLVPVADVAQEAAAHDTGCRHHQRDGQRDREGSSVRVLALHLHPPVEYRGLAWPPPASRCSPRNVPLHHPAEVVDGDDGIHRRIQDGLVHRLQLGARRSVVRGVHTPSRQIPHGSIRRAVAVWRSDLQPRIHGPEHLDLRTGGQAFFRCCEARTR